MGTEVMPVQYKILKIYYCNLNSSIPGQVAELGHWGARRAAHKSGNTAPPHSSIYIGPLFSPQKQTRLLYIVFVKVHPQITEKLFLLIFLT